MYFILLEKCLKRKKKNTLVRHLLALRWFIEVCVDSNEFWVFYCLPNECIVETAENKIELFVNQYCDTWQQEAAG